VYSCIKNGILLTIENLEFVFFCWYFEWSASISMALYENRMRLLCLQTNTGLLLFHFCCVIFDAKTSFKP
jgi:hypothetical protein